MTDKQVKAIRTAHGDMVDIREGIYSLDTDTTIKEMEEAFPFLLDVGLAGDPKEFDYYSLDLEGGTSNRQTITMAWLWDNDTSMADVFETEIQELEIGEDVYDDGTIIRRTK